MLSLSVFVVLLSAAHHVAAQDGADVHDPGTVTWQEPTDDQELMWIVSGVLGGLAILATLFTAVEHIRNWTSPSLQPFFVKMLMLFLVYPVSALGGLLVPFSISLFISMRWLALAFMVVTFLDAYRAYFGPHLTPALGTYRIIEVISSFIQVLPGTTTPVPLKVPPFSTIDIVKNPEAITVFLHERVYFPTRILMYSSCAAVLLALGLAPYGHLGYGSTSGSRAWFPLLIILTAFTWWALTGVVSFISALKPVLRPECHTQVIGILLLMTIIPFQELVIGGLALDEELDSGFEQRSVPLTASIWMNALICWESAFIAFFFVKGWGVSRFVRRDDYKDFKPPSWLKDGVAIPEPDFSAEADEEAGGEAPLDVADMEDVASAAAPKADTDAADPAEVKLEGDVDVSATPASPGTAHETPLIQEEGETSVV